MIHVKLHEISNDRLKAIVKERKEKEPHKGWNKQNVIADLIDKAALGETKWTIKNYIKIGGCTIL